MSTVGDAVEAGARALSEHWRDMHTNESLGQQRMLADHAARAMWPILSAPLREINTGDNRSLYGNDFEAGMANALWLVKGQLDQIDKELGLVHPDE